MARWLLLAALALGYIVTMVALMIQLVTGTVILLDTWTLAGVSIALFFLTVVVMVGMATSRR